MNVGEIHFEGPDAFWCFLIFCVACIPLGFVLAGIFAIMLPGEEHEMMRKHGLKLHWLQRGEPFLRAACYWVLAALLAWPIVSIAGRQIDRFERMLYAKGKVLLIYPWPRVDREISVAEVKRFEFEPYRSRRGRQRSHWRLALWTNDGKKLISGPKEPEEWEKELPELFKMVPEFKQIDRTDYSLILR